MKEVRDKKRYNSPIDGTHGNIFGHPLYDEDIDPDRRGYLSNFEYSDGLIKVSAVRPSST